jgi:hypothetical protein
MRRLVSLLALSIVIVPLLTATSTVPAGAAPGTGSVTGTIKKSATATLAGMCVNVVDASTSSSVGTSAATAANGIWQLNNVPASTTYTAFAFDCSGGNYVGVWYINTPFQSNATHFAVPAGGTTTGINVRLKLGGAVTGKVKDSLTNAPIAGITVIPIRLDQFVAASFAACTDANGHYTLHGLPTTGVKIQFAGNSGCSLTGYNNQFYKHKSTYASATVVPIKKGITTTGINDKLTHP